jgi:two-component system invasion response regulator UvrY
LNVLKELKQIRPGLPILILSIHSELEHAIRAFQAGAAGFILKDSRGEEMVKAVNHVINGGRYVSAAIAERLATDLNRSTGRPLHQALSYREFEVMCLIASGGTLGEIAGLLGLSDKTVSTYRARVLEKTGMRTNGEIIRYVVHLGLGELQSKQFMRPTRPLRNARSTPAAGGARIAGRSANSSV